MTLYIYRVGWTYPAKNPIYRSKSIKIPSCTRTLLGPVRPTGQTGRSYQTGYRRLDRSDRLGVPVRPVCSCYCQFWLSTLTLSAQLTAHIYPSHPLHHPSHICPSPHNSGASLRGGREFRRRQLCSITMAGRCCFLPLSRLLLLVVLLCAALHGGGAVARL